MDEVGHAWLFNLARGVTDQPLLVLLFLSYAQPSFFLQALLQVVDFAFHLGPVSFFVRIDFLVRQAQLGFEGLFSFAVSVAVDGRALVLSVHGGVRNCLVYNW